MAKQPKVSFEEMTKIYENWDKQGTQEAVFKTQGWTRTKYFNESYYRQFPEERPVSNKSDSPKIK